MQIIIEDEMRNEPVHIPETARRLGTDKDFSAAQEIIEAKAKVHLRLRSETFGYPVSEKHLAEIDKGENVEPLPIDFFRVTPVSPYSL